MVGTRRKASDPGAASAVHIRPLGDAAVSVEFDNRIDPAVNEAVAALDLAIAAAEIIGITETVPSYRALLVSYEPDQLDFPTLVARLRELLAEASARPPPRPRRFVVPVAYGGAHGIDLEEAAALLGLGAEQTIAAHLAQLYRVYLIGFAPGLPHLGPLPDCLQISRRPEPRPSIVTGSVIIGGVQAAITTTAIPCAWYILGRTPLRAYEPRHADPFLFRTGDLIRFRRIDAEEYAQLEAAAEAGEPVFGREA